MPIHELAYGDVRGGLETNGAILVGTHALRLYLSIPEGGRYRGVRGYRLVRVSAHVALDQRMLRDDRQPLYKDLELYTSVGDVVIR